VRLAITQIQALVMKLDSECGKMQLKIPIQQRHDCVRRVGVEGLLSSRLRVMVEGVRAARRGCRQRGEGVGNQNIPPFRWRRAETKSRLDPRKG
jgi:hypothetical protein